MGKPWTTPTERARLRNAMAAVLRACAREGLPVPSYRHWPGVLHEQAGLDVSERQSRREMRALIEQTPADLRWALDGRHRRVAVLLAPGQWSDFTPLNCVLRGPMALTRRPIGTGDSDFFDEEVSAGRAAWSATHHLRRLASVAASARRPMAELYR